MLTASVTPTEQTLMIVFYLDDDSEDLELFGEAIADVDPAIEFCGLTDSKLALQRLRDSMPPDLIFLDYNMPVFNGEDCLDKIKLIPKLALVPVVIYSTSVDGVLRSRLIGKGAAMVVEKHRSTKDLKAFLKRNFLAAAGQT
jgi:CheY-like chemotaxis protein